MRVFSVGSYRLTHSTHLAQSHLYTKTKKHACSRQPRNRIKTRRSPVCDALEHTTHKTWKRIRVVYNTHHTRVAPSIQQPAPHIKCQTLAARARAPHVVLACVLRGMRHAAFRVKCLQTRWHIIQSIYTHIRALSSLEVSMNSIVRRETERERERSYH